MSTITTLPSAINASKSVIDTNFSNLNTDKAEKSGGTFTGDISVPDEAYGAGWNGSLEVPTKNAIYDKIETMLGGGSSTLAGLTDVTIATPTNGQALIYETATSKWKNQSLAGGGDMLKSTYDPANIAQQVVGTTATQTISGKTLTTPRFADLGFIADSNGNEMLAFNSNASAVNYLELENGTTTNPPHLRSKGDDTNIGLHLVGKGTGEVSVCDGTDETKRMRFNVANNGTGIITTFRSNSTGSSQIIDLPNRSGTLADNTDLATKAALAGSTSQAFSVSQLEVGNTDTTISRVSAGRIAVEGVNVPTISSTDTFTNKRITKRIQSASPVSSPYQINSDNTDTQEITTLGIALQFQNPSGTPTNGQLIMVRIKDNGTARALTYDTQFASGADTLPTTTVISKWTWILVEWVSSDSKWYCIATGTQP